MHITIFKVKNKVNDFGVYVSKDLRDDLQTDEIIFSQSDMYIKPSIIDSRHTYNISKQGQFHFAAKFDHSIEGQYQIFKEDDTYYLEKVDNG